MEELSGVFGRSGRWVGAARVCARDRAGCTLRPQNAQNVGSLGESTLPGIIVFTSTLVVTHLLLCSSDGFVFTKCDVVVVGGGAGDSVLTGQRNVIGASRNNFQGSACCTHCFGTGTSVKLRGGVSHSSYFFCG